MSEKKVGKRLLTWVLVLVMTLSLLPLNVLAASPAVMRIVRPDTDKYITYNFYLNEGDKTPHYSQIIKNNESLDAPATPEKKDYKFVGWYDGDEQFSNFGTAITVTEGSTDVALYAKFVPVCYVYFMDGTGEGARIIATKEVTATDPLMISVMLLSPSALMKPLPVGKMRAATISLPYPSTMALPISIPSLKKATGLSLTLTAAAMLHRSS